MVIFRPVKFNFQNKTTSTIFSVDGRILLTSLTFKDILIFEFFYLLSNEVCRNLISPVVISYDFLLERFLV